MPNPTAPVRTTPQTAPRPSPIPEPDTKRRYKPGEVCPDQQGETTRRLR